MAQSPDFGPQDQPANGGYDFYAGAAAEHRMDPDVLGRIDEGETAVVIEFPTRPIRPLRTPEEAFDDWVEGKFDAEDARAGYPTIGHTAVAHMPARTSSEERAQAEQVLQDHSRRVNPANKRAL